MMNEEIIYFNINNWCGGEDYPDKEPFETWMDTDQLMDNEWARENNICILFSMLDMAYNFAVSAPRSWIEENCPIILEEPWYSKFCTTEFDENFFLEYTPENFGVTK